MQLTRKQIHEQVYFYILIFLAVTLSFSVLMSSICMILLALNWVLEGRLKEKWLLFKGNRALQIFLLLFGLHLAGLLWSDDLGYGLRDMKIKLPLLLFPVLVATSAPLTRQQLQRILLFFTLGVFVASMASLFKLLGWLPGSFQDHRDLSLFMSHIRFSLTIVLALLISVYVVFVRRNTVSRAEGFFFLAALLWFPVFLALLKSLSGLIIASILAFLILLRLVFEIRDQAIRFMAFVPVILLPLFSIIYLGQAVNRFYSADALDVAELDSHTVEGNRYLHMPESRDVENGHYIWIHICDKELERDWKTLSDLDYRGRTANGNSVRTTLIRYLSSRGLRKDAVGLKQLSETEIRAIEGGTANYIYLDHLKLYPRIYELIWEIDRYRLGGDPNEKSVVQRCLYLEAGWHIAREHLWFGVGNGDVWNEFREYYESVQSPLEPKWRRKAHNQFLTFLISFGIPGLIICLLALIAPPFLGGRQRSFLAMGFLVLILLSMLSEDTLETATGAAFAGYFYALFIFGPDFPWLRRKITEEDG
ncbi:MAG: O-antigen ligase family protein [Bacteroidales bacterium]|nr:O-antigen ligase family protein [Bacteroidales bacterium]